MAAQRRKLTRKQQKAIVALLACPSIEAAAAVAGIGQRSLYRWLRLDQFQQAYASARKEIVSQAVTKLQATMTAAVDTLQTVMSDPEAPPSARVSAAKTVLDLALKSGQLEEVETRLAAIEKRIERGNR